MKIGDVIYYCNTEAGYYEDDVVTLCCPDYDDSERKVTIIAIYCKDRCIDVVIRNVTTDNRFFSIASGAKLYFDDIVRVNVSDEN